MRRTRKSVSYLTMAAAGVIPIVAFIGGVMMGAFRIYEDIATKPFVINKVDEATANAKLREAEILDKAIVHSDRNHDDMVSRMKDISSDQKAMGVKIDMVLDYQQEKRRKGRGND